jgi:hypothetical protein
MTKKGEMCLAPSECNWMESYQIFKFIGMQLLKILLWNFQIFSIHGSKQNGLFTP